MFSSNYAHEIDNSLTNWRTDFMQERSKETFNPHIVGFRAMS